MSPPSLPGPFHPTARRAARDRAGRRLVAPGDRTRRRRPPGAGGPVRRTTRGSSPVHRVRVAGTGPPWDRAPVLRSGQQGTATPSATGRTRGVAAGTGAGRRTGRPDHSGVRPGTPRKPLLLTVTTSGARIRRAPVPCPLPARPNLRRIGCTARPSSRTMTARRGLVAHSRPAPGPSMRAVPSHAP
ncbi:hypothetical protein KCH_32420 [Kitasatospora cheerisanensis KCTC 2395]|uniref:Uncharacterized protein n=1 Tax=Kitasatospora cheerisanensis KCTC 2395 TaxID=1348663 RepID=A0A066YUC2_9ACTN|nr:hypothetical protein KCH_32420 [Kitasatospora cheerisanensis KCTC 2395]